MNRTTLFALALFLPACCSAESSAPPSRASCASLPECSTLGAVDPEAVYGEICTSSLGSYQWRGQPWCCDAEIVYARCVTRAIGGETCDPDAPASCDDGLVCRPVPVPICGVSP